MQGKQPLIILSSLTGVFLILLFGYVGWNLVNPESTCASCHEIASSAEILQQSAHREVACQDCHGTALGNSLHSLKENVSMVFIRLGTDEVHLSARLNEQSVLQVMEACTGCHPDEFTRWRAGGHSATYADIFLNETHNRLERTYPDCFRCHGMYYGGTIKDLIDPISMEGPWSLKDPGIASKPAIPCLTCHPIHMENRLKAHPGSLDDPDAISYKGEQRNPLTGLYLRSDKLLLRADMLRKPDMIKKGEPVLVSDDPIQRICMQCHAPNWAHEAGSEDDRTPTGVHEGMSCRACHQDHSTNALNACQACHPAVSNCGLNVRTMNTTYDNRESPNNIHSMECKDCHNPVPY